MREYWAEVSTCVSTERTPCVSTERIPHGPWRRKSARARPGSTITEVSTSNVGVICRTSTGCVVAPHEVSSRPVVAPQAKSSRNKYPRSSLLCCRKCPKISCPITCSVLRVRSGLSGSERKVPKSL
eukprot:1585627-Rhodomonas_salina.1